MAWTTFPTLTDGQVLTGAHMQLVRDNFAETAPAKATTAGRFIVTTGANTIAERIPTNNFVGTSETTTSNVYTDRTTVGPAVTVTTGTRAIVAVTCDAWNSTLSAYSWMSYAVSGASTVSASDSIGMGIRSATADAATGSRCSYIDMNTSLTGGSNVFTAKYRATTANGKFGNRALLVIPL